MNLSIIKQEFLTILSRRTFYLESIMFPLTLSIVMVLSLKKQSESSHIFFIILLSAYGIMQNALSGSARSIEKEKYQGTLSFYFLSDTSLISLVINKLITNIIIGVINFCIIILIFSSIFSLHVHDYFTLVLGFMLLIIVSLIFAFFLSSFYFKMTSPYAMSAILVKLVLLITGILIPFELLPKPLLFIFSCTGGPQAFSLLMYGLKGVKVLDLNYFLVLPVGLSLQMIFAANRFLAAEKDYLSKGGI